MFHRGTRGAARPVRLRRASRDSRIRALAAIGHVAELSVASKEPVMSPRRTLRRNSGLDFFCRRICYALRFTRLSPRRPPPRRNRRALSLYVSYRSTCVSGRAPTRAVQRHAEGHQAARPLHGVASVTFAIYAEQDGGSRSGPKRKTSSPTPTAIQRCCSAPLPRAASLPNFSAPASRAGSASPSRASPKCRA